jgi:hypothetical protein
MTREEVINIMIDTVNTFNAKLAKENGLSDQQIADTIVAQKPSLETMFGLIYNDLAAKDVFK